MVNAFSKEEDKFLFQMIYEGGYRLPEICDKAFEKFNERRKRNSYLIRVQNLIYFFTEADYRYRYVGLYHDGTKVNKLPKRQEKELNLFLKDKSKEIFIYNLEAFGHTIKDK